MSDLLQFTPDPPVRVNDVRIGCIGAGMIMAECHLPAYRSAGFPVVAIASRTRARAEAVAQRHGIAKVHDTPFALIEDPDVEIVDLAFPPDLQPDLLRHALRQPHVKGVLIQKPLALTLNEAISLREAAAASGKLVSVNQNMRFDQSMRVLHELLDRNALGIPVFAEINMHAIPHWQGFLQQYDRLTLLNMSVHHLDIMRFLFGDPSEVTAVVRPDPRTGFEHTDGLVVSTLRFPSGLLALSLEDVWSGPSNSGFTADPFIRWRVEGTEGIAQGTIGWPTGAVSTLTYASNTETGGQWITPTWDSMWFPDAFVGVMEQLQYAVRTGTEPLLTIADNVGTAALVEAAYRSIADGRTVRLSEFPTTAKA
ncbi:Gfo/Idh/MocA family protein [uncultured Devosia sp.]|uniref:Gfo/Idh/MocA family protein n=1 Tax=uncultured Devosia sp. TaxID=211434 RepID=UPI0035CB3E57